MVQVDILEPITILLVEDDEEFRAVLETELEDEGYRVLGAASGELALEIAETAEFDLVVTDVKLGGIDGLDTLEELKRGRTELQSLVITGYATESDSVRALSLGVGKYMKKPFKLPDFLMAVEHVTKEILSERTRAKFLSAVLKTALWGLESRGKQVFSDDQIGLVQAARASERVALHLGLEMKEARQIRLAVLASGVQHSQAGADVPFLMEILPEESTWLVQRLETGDEEQSTDEQTIASLGLKLASFSNAEPWDMPEPWKERFEGALSGEGVPEVGTDGGGLLALAKAFEASGDLQSASSVLSRLEEREGRQSAHALLSKAKLSLIDGDHREVTRLLEQAQNAARGLRSTSEVHLEGGVLFSAIGSTEKSQEWLESAVNGFSELQNGLEMSRAQLALASASGSEPANLAHHLRYLLSPTGLESLLKSADWLFPYLLGLDRSTQVQRALDRMARDVPHLVNEAFGRLPSVEAQLRVLEIIKRVGIEGYDDLLQDLILGREASLRREAESLLTFGEAVRVVPVLRLYTLGTMVTWVGQKRVPDKGWTGRRPFYVLTYLAQHQSAFQTQDHLADLFWPGSRRGTKNLNQVLVLIRNTLRSPDWPDKIDYVTRKGSLVGINPEHAVWHDATVLRETLRESERLLKAGNRAKAAELLEQASELDRGAYLESCFDDWALNFRTALDAELVARFCDLAEIRLDQALPELALEAAQRVLGKEPFSNRALMSRLRAYIALGRHEEAVRVFERVEPRMKRELDIEPSIELVKIYNQAKLGL
jgi:DNA-binding response OmpR family regulator